MTSFVRKFVVAASFGVFGMVCASNVNADFTVIDLTVSGSVPASQSTLTGSTTKIVGTNIQVTIGTLHDSAVNLSGFLNFTLTSVGQATLAGGMVSQEFTGSFTVSSLVGGGGTNYLTGTGLDGILSGSNTGATSHTQTFAFNLSGNPTFTSTDPTLAALFASSPLETNYGNIKFTVNALPPGGFYNSTVKSYKSFTGNTTQGTFNTDVTVVPEPSSIALMGLGVIGLALAARRKRAAAI